MPEGRGGKVCGEQLGNGLVTSDPRPAHESAGEAAWKGEKTSKGGTAWWGDSFRRLLKTPRTPWSVARCNRRAGSKRRKPSRWRRTTETERG
jgi:hypothetical protein